MRSFFGLPTYQMMLTSIQSPHRSYEYIQLVHPNYFSIQYQLPRHNLRNIVKYNTSIDTIIQ